MHGGNDGTPRFPIFLDENQLQFDSNASTAQFQLSGSGEYMSSHRILGFVIINRVLTIMMLSLYLRLFSCLSTALVV